MGPSWRTGDLHAALRSHGAAYPNCAGAFSLAIKWPNSGQSQFVLMHP